MNIKPDQMRSGAAGAGRLLKAMANRHRLLLLCQIGNGEKSVGELAQFLGLRNSTVSQHLALLRKDGLVSTRRDGQTIWYDVASDPARKLIETLYGIYCGPSQKGAAQSKTKAKPRKSSR